LFLFRIKKEITARNSHRNGAYLRGQFAASYALRVMSLQDKVREICCFDRPCTDIFTIKLRRQDVTANKCEIFRVVCKFGRLDVARLLFREFALSRDELMVDNNHAFVMACEYGFLKLAQWLYVRTVMNREEALINDCIAFSLACANGHLAVAMWLHSELVLSDEDAAAHNNLARTMAARDNHSDVSSWLDKTFKEIVKETAHELA
jgi:hypothetical protein